MAAFEQAIEKAVANEEIPGCVLCATNRDGSFQYKKVFGTNSMHPPPGARTPLQPTAIMWIASCTKLMTAICCMQLVDRGLITLDAPVYPYIPELTAFKILKGFNPDGSPIEEQHKTPITLRLLLTHTSGLAYDALHPDLMRWRKYHGKDKDDESEYGLLKRFNMPLVFEPGSGWMYGSGIDYAGLLLERVTKMTLEEYMKTNLWEPLGITDITFFPRQRQDLLDKKMDMSTRDPETGKATHVPNPSSYSPVLDMRAPDCQGGHGAFGSASSYIKVLHALLTSDADEKLLKKESVEEIFRPQLNEGGKAGLAAIMETEFARNAMGGPSGPNETDHALGGLVITGDEEGGRSAGTLVWGGLPNLTWFVDRKAGLCGLYATQVVPPGDGKCAELTRGFEKRVYELYEKSGAKESQL